MPNKEREHRAGQRKGRHAIFLPSPAAVFAPSGITTSVPDRAARKKRLWELNLSAERKILTALYGMMGCQIFPTSERSRHNFHE
ncbi:MAG: hypothetical protein U0Y68_05550 [Blastocatellia bacterium]